MFSVRHELILYYYFASEDQYQVPLKFVQLQAWRMRDHSVSTARTQTYKIPVFLIILSCGPEHIIRERKYGFILLLINLLII